MLIVNQHNETKYVFTQFGRLNLKSWKLNLKIAKQNTTTDCKNLSSKSQSTHDTFLVCIT